MEAGLWRNNLRSEISDLRSEVSDPKSQISDLRSEVSELQLLVMGQFLTLTTTRLFCGFTLFATTTYNH
jgi:hypothetical protein